MNETKRMSSIAKKINRHFWWKLLLSMLMIDILLVTFIVIDFCGSAEHSIAEDTEIAERYFMKDENGELSYLIVDSNAENYWFPLTDTLDTFKVPGIILLVAEFAVLIETANDVKIVRRRLRPLNELAKKAETLSRLAFDTSKFDSLEEAILNIRPEAPDAKIQIGDKDLRSLEIAINNLLERMRQTYRQQNRFVSDASHELRTPIAVIQGYVNMLDRWGKDDPEILQEAIDAMKNESEHMKNLVEQLLFLARGDSGRNPFKPTMFSLSELIREIGEEYQMIDDKHRYLTEIRNEGTVFADSDLIKQSIRIFADNAIKYSGDNTIIRLGVQKIGKDVVYWVCDEGCGMEAEEVKHMFERFYRSDAARNSQTGGTGLGLSIAKWIVDAHGGRIEVISRQGIGTKIKIWLKQ